MTIKYWWKYKLHAHEFKVIYHDVIMWVFIFPYRSLKKGRVELFHWHIILICSADSGISRKFTNAVRVSKIDTWMKNCGIKTWISSVSAEWHTKFRNKVHGQANTTHITCDS